MVRPRGQGTRLRPLLLILVMVIVPEQEEVSAARVARVPTSAVITTRWLGEYRERANLPLACLLVRLLLSTGVMGLTVLVTVLVMAREKEEVVSEEGGPVVVKEG